MDNNKKIKDIVLLVQIILTVFGFILSIVLFFKSINSPSLLGVLGSIVSLVSYMAIIIYTIKDYNKKEDIYFQLVVYTYLAVLGIQILQAGNFIADYGLNKNTVMLINCCNLISFANVIKFVDNINFIKKAMYYVSIAVVLKLLIELYLIIKMFEFIELIHILMSLSIPLLGITIIVAYVYRIRRIGKK